MGKGKIARCGRGTISIIFSILILLAGFLLIVYIMNEQKKISVDTTECGEKKVSFEQAREDYIEYGNFDNLNVRCYCLQGYKEKSTGVQNFEWTIRDDAGNVKEIVKPCS